MYREHTLTGDHAGQLNKLHGKWEDDCPFEFDYEVFNSKVKVKKILKHKSIDGDQYALIQRQDKLAIIAIYSNNQQIKQIEVRRLDDEWKYNKITFNSEYLCLISESQSKLYYYNFNYNKRKYCKFTDGLILSFKYQQNQLNVIVSKYEHILSLYRIDQFVEFEYVEQGFYAQHCLGFFKRDGQKISLLSNQILKPISTFSKQYFNQVNIQDIFASNIYEQYCFLLKNIIFLEIESGVTTLMTQLRNGKSIRKIEHTDDAMWAHYSKEIFHHFLIICSQLSKYYNACDIYDLKKGRYVASIIYEANKSIHPVTFVDDQIIIPAGYGWKIKKKYLDN